MLSLSKLLLTVAIIVAVFWIGRSLTRRADSLMRKPPEQKKKPEAVELAKCSVCDTYVGPDSPPCEREDCPQRA